MTKTPERTLVLIMITIIITLCTAWAATGIKKNTFPLRMNIFDEIFYDTQNYFGYGGNKIPRIEGVSPFQRYGFLGEPVGSGPIYEYDNDQIPPGYNSIFIDFIFIDTQEKTVDFYFTKTVEGGFRIHFSNLYDSKTKKLSITATFDEGEHTEGRGYDHQITQKLLTAYDITSADLDSYNEAILNDLVLADWTTVYHSRFSPDDYGNVEVTKQW